MPDCPDGQVAMTVGMVWNRVIQDSQHASFKEWADRLTRGCETEADKCAVIWDHVKHSIRFKRDEETSGRTDIPVNHDDVVEVIIRPLDMMGYVGKGCAVGDCDDFSSYTAALLTANGIDCRFATVAADGRDPSQYTHVYVVAYPLLGDQGNPFGKDRVPMDASHGEYCGWEVPNRYGKFKEWGSSDPLQMVMTMGWIGLGLGFVWMVLKGVR